MPDQLDREARSALMARVRTKDTAPELLLRKAMWSAGLRGWRVHPKGIPGRPDLAWIGRRVAVFVDGAFWHGHPDYYRGQSGPFWDEKIARNRARDEKVNRTLKDAGWTVVRLWDFEVERSPTVCISRINASLR
jgi:DNA mismatch endonuclease, patch repair protein